LAWLESGLGWLHSWGCAWLQASWGDNIYCSIFKYDSDFFLLFYFIIKYILLLCYHRHVTISFFCVCGLINFININVGLEVKLITIVVEDLLPPCWLDLPTCHHDFSCGTRFAGHHEQLTWIPVSFSKKTEIMTIYDTFLSFTMVGEV
jgi:hypothetical protein